MGGGADFGLTVVLVLSAASLLSAGVLLTWVRGLPPRVSEPAAARPGHARWLQGSRGRGPGRAEAARRPDGVPG